MTCKLCGGLGKGALRGMICPACGGTGMARAAVSTPAEKTLLDEFAMAAMAAIIGKIPLGTRDEDEEDPECGMTARGAYSYAAAMMKERNRRDEMGNVKEATEQ